MARSVLFRTSASSPSRRRKGLLRFRTSRSASRRAYRRLGHRVARARAFSRRGHSRRVGWRETTRRSAFTKVWRAPPSTTPVSGSIRDLYCTKRRSRIRLPRFCIMSALTYRTVHPRQFPPNALLRSLRTRHRRLSRPRYANRCGFPL